jgi:hypothetical protein
MPLISCVPYSETVFIFYDVIIKDNKTQTGFLKSPGASTIFPYIFAVFFH